MKKVSEIAQIMRVNRQKIYRLIDHYHIEPVQTINKINFYDEKVLIKLLEANVANNNDRVTSENAERTTFNKSDVSNSVTTVQVLLQQNKQLQDQIKVKDDQINQLQMLLKQQQRLLDQQQQLELQTNKLMNKSNSNVSNDTTSNGEKTTSVTKNTVNFDNENSHKKWWQFWY